MCSRFILSALFFSLAHGPQVMFLHAQEPDELSTPTPLSHNVMLVTSSPAESLVTSPENSNSVSEAESTASMNTDVPVTTSHITSAPETQPVMTTHTEGYSTSTEIPQVPTTTVTPEVSTTQPIRTTESPDPQTTTERSGTTVQEDVEEDPQTSSPVPTSAPRTTGTTASEATAILTTPTEETTENPHSTMATNSITILPTQDKEKDHFSTETPVVTEDHTTTVTEDHITTVTEDHTTTVTEDHTTTVTDTAAGAVQKDEESGSNWLLIIIVAVVAICLLTGFCIIVFVKRRKKSGQQNFGHMNGRNQRSKKKKGENDAWAGPVNLEGGQTADCEDPVEGGQGDNRNPDGTDGVLSTFAALEANGGVGRPGSMEAQKWEEQEPLLFIDEDLKGEGKDKQKEGAEKAKGQKGEEVDGNKNMEMKEPELNGGETFCLTTAV